MNEDLKFPIKYAVLELKSPGGYSTNYEDVTEGFIVSKCYVVGSEVKYFPTGEAKVTYKVYFPYDDIENFMFNGRDVIRMLGIDACNNYYSVHIVEGIFDTYEEAKEEADHRNKCLKSLAIVRATFAEDTVKETIIDNFEQKMQLCQKYEDFIAENTKGMKVTKDDRLDSLRRLRKREE